MHSKTAVAALVLAALLAAPGGAGLAKQAQVQAKREQRAASAGQAIEIARRHGLVRVKELSNTGKTWTVGGRDERNREIEVVIDIRTGRVVDINRG